MIPVIAIVGRPNVGKSTLFNVLTRSREALVANQPGVTRDRQYGLGKMGDRKYWLIDTGGIEESLEHNMDTLTDQQVVAAIGEADAVLFVVDAKSGLTAADREVAARLRVLEKPAYLVVNKADRLEADLAASEFYELGLSDPFVIAAAHKRGVKPMIEQVLSILPEETEDEVAEEETKGLKIAFVGRPNVGKSTLVNRILGEERVVVMDMPGTTRDSIAIPFQRRDEDYVLIDTAGVRRRTKVKESIEKFSVLKTLQAIERADVAIQVIDASEGITDQDLNLTETIIEEGCGLILAFNKWDGLSAEEREKCKAQIERRLNFANFARRYFISALHGSGVGNLFNAIDELRTVLQKKISTAELTRAVADAVKQHQPPLVKGRRIKLRYVHVGGHHPLLFVVHGKQVEKLPGSYQRYLVKYLREHFKLNGLPIHLRLVSDDNPYAKDKK